MHVTQLAFRVVWVLDRQRKIIGERRLGLVEGDTMLFNVLAFFLRIPFEFEHEVY